MCTVTLRRTAAIGFLLLALTARSSAAEPKEWITLNNCTYVEAKDNDGDSFHMSGGDKTFALRLYFVDAPETNLIYPDRVREQAEHFGITIDETLKTARKAKERVQELLKEPFTVQTRWASAAGRGSETRYYGFVTVRGKSLAEILVSEGLARAKGVAPNLPNGEKASAYKEKLGKLEAAAREKRLGAWATSTKENPASHPATKPQ